MGVVLAMAAASVAAFLITTARVVGWSRILRHSTLVDVIFTIGLGFMFFGTLTGMLVAVIGGLFMAMFLTLLKAVLKAGAVFERKPGRYDDEYRNGKWVYNEAPYI